MLEDLAGLLVDHGHGVLGETLFLSRLPDQPDACTVLFASPASRPPAFTHDGPQPALRHPRVQVLVRDADYPSASSRAHQVYATLCEVVNLTLGTTRYRRISPLQEPFPLAPDASGRTFIVCNYEVTW